MPDDTPATRRTRQRPAPAVAAPHAPLPISLGPRPKHKSHLMLQRPPFERIALLLQGGGALGSYQGGVFQALAEAGIEPDWISGISIGSINAAIIAGNPPEHRVERLRAFWDGVTTPPFGALDATTTRIEGDLAHNLLNQVRAFGNLLSGAPGFFTPRLPPPYLFPDGAREALSFYDTAPLKATLERLVDFDRINHQHGMRLSVGAVNIRSGNFVYFDSATHHMRAEHIIASGSLPPGFAPTEIEGEFYWDGGLVSNTPLQWVLDSVPRQDTLAFQVDLWSARGEIPRNLMQSETRQKEIRYSSRTRAGTDVFRRTQRLRRAAAKLLEQLSPEQRGSDEARLLEDYADQKVYNLVQLIYRAQAYEGASKDYEFSRRTMEEHWLSGYHDACRTLRHPEVLERPHGPEGVFTFDLARDGRE